MGRSDNTKEQNQKYDAVYHFRNRKERNAKAKEKANAEEQRIYRRLYSRWRYAVSGNKISKNELFDKPDKRARELLVKEKSLGCILCGSKNNLELDHEDGYPNNNSLANLQWLCDKCHKKKTEKERLKGLYSQYQYLANKKPWSK